MAGLILWLTVGLAVGAAGRLLLPGPPTSWLVMIGCGLIGGLVGGFTATLLDMGGLAEFDLRSAVLALLTAVLLVVLVQLLRTRQS